jgi:DNA-binding SARP family transcriptional activator
MICYAKLGLTADAVRTYNRCRSTLANHLGIRPSAETQAIYTSAFIGLIQKTSVKSLA